MTDDHKLEGLEPAAEPVAWVYRYIGKDPYPKGLAERGYVIARSVSELSGIDLDLQTWERLYPLYPSPDAAVFKALYDDAEDQCTKLSADIFALSKRSPDTATINLMVDACVAIESLLYPKLADKRCDPAAVNARLLAWIDKFVMEPEAKQSSGLQPIATAPKNERVLVFGKHSNGTDEFATGWLDMVDNRWYYSPQRGLINYWTPTHWMPIPEHETPIPETPLQTLSEPGVRGHASGPCESGSLALMATDDGLLPLPDQIPPSQFQQQVSTATPSNLRTGPSQEGADGSAVELVERVTTEAGNWNHSLFSTAAGLLPSMSPQKHLVETLMLVRNEILKLRAETASNDKDCICRGNWRKILEECDHLIGREFRDRSGKVHTFFGVVHSKDDYYYGMNGKHGLLLLSCVGNLSSHGFVLAGKNEPNRRSKPY